MEMICTRTVSMVAAASAFQCLLHDGMIGFLLRSLLLLLLLLLLPLLVWPADITRQMSARVDANNEACMKQLLMQLQRHAWQAAPD